MTTSPEYPVEETKPAGLPPGPEEGLVERLRAEVEEAQREKAQFKAHLQRVQADFLNYRRQVEQEREAFQRQAAGALLQRLLPVLDDMELTVNALPGGDTLPWAEGVRLAVRKLFTALGQAGLEAVDPVGKPFDPWEHEAVGQEVSDSFPPGSVLRVTRKGYKYQGRLLRPALVIVAQAPSPSSAPEGQTAAEASPSAEGERGSP
jgi:molecular chaperone GrpE